MTMENKQMIEKSSLGHLPVGSWTFDAEVADVFSDMLKRSIPNYEIMRELVFDIAVRTTPADSYVVDLGCSNGESLAPLVRHLGERNRYIGVDASEPMVAAARERFREEINKNLVEIQQLDLRVDYPKVNAGVTLSILTLQFVPINYRQLLCHKIYASTLQRGVFLLVEKVIGETDHIDNLMIRWYEEKKARSGYSSLEIAEKRKSLEGVLVPLKPSWNLQLLREAGFRKIDCFWRCMNFAGWIAVK